MGRSFDHVVFDLDGTLVDSLADIAEAVNHARARLGLAPLPLAIVGGYVGDGARLLIERALGAGQRSRWSESLAIFMEYYDAHLLDRTGPYPGIAEMLALLAERGVTLSVLSNKPAEMCRRILDGVRLMPHFAYVLGGDSLPTRKPEPGGLEYLAQATRTPLARMLLVGDSPVDGHTAAAAGAGFCGVAWGYASADLVDSRIQTMIADPIELLSMVEPSISTL